MGISLKIENAQFEAVTMTETAKFEMASRGLMANPSLQSESESVAASLATLYVSRQINQKELENFALLGIAALIMPRILFRIHIIHSTVY